LEHLQEAPVTEEKRPGSEIIDELEALGQQLTTAIRSLWQSEESRKFRQEIGQGFTDLGKQIDAAFKAAQDSEAAKEFSGQVKETVDKARESDIVGKVERSLVAGLHDLNEEFSKTVASLQKQQPPAEPPADSPEDQA